MVAYRTNLTKEDLDSLTLLVGESNISVKGPDLDQHAKDESFHAAHRPFVVVWPTTTAEISMILKFANQRRIPVTPWGAGTSLEGNPIPVLGGIILDTLRMDKIFDIRPNDLQVDVQSGVRYKDMNAVLAQQGLFFAPDPGANASIGGMIANNAAGTRTIRYGATKDNVLRLEIVLPSGEIIRTGTRSTKSSAGYDLVHLFVGSEGTLGVVTEATLRLAPLPDKFSAVIVSFPVVEAATRTVSRIIGFGITPAALEFLDSNVVKAVNAATELNLPEHPTLLMEFHGATENALKEELGEIETLSREEGCLSFEAGLGRSDRDRMWRARHQTYDILIRCNPERSFVIVDVAVPVSQYPLMVATAQRVLSEHGLLGYLVGHAGDGNLHPLVPYSPGDPASYAIAFAAEKKIVEAAIGMGGTCSGEHGVGIGKRSFMALEHGASLHTMRAIKTALDPNGILNPGKIFEVEQAAMPESLAGPDIRD